MKPSSIAIFVGLVAFVGLLVYSAMRQGKTECELCLRFQGRVTCRSAAAADRKDAIAAARTAVCAQVAPGINETMLCNQAPVARLTCR